MCSVLPSFKTQAVNHLPTNNVFRVTIFSRITFLFISCLIVSVARVLLCFIQIKSSSNFADLKVFLLFYLFQVRSDTRGVRVCIRMYSEIYESFFLQSSQWFGQGSGEVSKYMQFLCDDILNDQLFSRLCVFRISKELIFFSDSCSNLLLLV